MILDEAKVARARLASAEAASSSVAEAEALAKKKNELRALAAKVESLANRRGMLRQGDVPLSAAHDVEKAKQLCRMVLARFTESPKSATLVDKQRWTKLADALAEINVSEETLQSQDWKSYHRSKLFGGASPDQRRQMIIQTLPTNIEALADYTRLYQQFIRYRNVVPNNREELYEVQECSRRLSETDQQFVNNNDVPPVVQLFFSAIATSSGANLDMLTSEVIGWLRTNNMLNNYAVRAR